MPLLMSAYAYANFLNFSPHRRVVVGVASISAAACMHSPIAARRVYILNKKLLYRCCRNARVNSKRTPPRAYTHRQPRQRCVRLFVRQFYSAMCSLETGCSPHKCLMGFSPTNWPHAFIAFICLYNAKCLCLAGVFFLLLLL